MSGSEEASVPEARVEAANPTAERVRLKISAARPFTEIRVLDATFGPQPLAANSGLVEIDVTPGLYEVGFRSGECWESQHVVAEPGAGEILVRQTPPACPDPDRIALAMRSSEEAVAGQRDDQASVVISLRTGADGPAENGGSPAPDLQGITVTLIAADETGEVAADRSPELPSQWRFSVAPGYWRLRINEAHPRQPFEMPITVVPGYVAHVSAPMRTAGDGPCVDLERLRVRLLRADAAGMVNDDLIQFEEAALAALGSGRSLFGPELERLIDDLADDKALNPMLGIFAAHLCEHSHDDHPAFRERLLARLGELTGAPAVLYPDVTVLRLAFQVRRGLPIDAEPPMPFPPVLAASWRLLLQVAGQEPSLIQRGSLCERIADRLWSSSLWTAWTAPPLEAEPVRATRRVAAARADQPAAPDGLAASAERIAALLDRVELRQWVREAASVADQFAEGLAWDHDSAVTPAEAAIASALYPIAQDEEQQSRLARFAEKHALRPPPSEAADPDRMAARLGLPRTTIERALSSLFEKLDARAAGFKIDL